MMLVPPKVRIPLCIEQGCVFNFLLELSDSATDSKNRYFIVLNANPKTDSVLIMITATKQIDKKLEFVKKAGISKDTIIIVSHKEYPTFTHDSAFNCNQVYEVNIDDLIRKIEENGSMNYPKIPSNLLKKVISGVKASPRISLALKNLL